MGNAKPRSRNKAVHLELEGEPVTAGCLMHQAAGIVSQSVKGQGKQSKKVVITANTNPQLTEIWLEGDVIPKTNKENP